jgi:HlyD family secretion protein
MSSYPAARSSSLGRWLWPIAAVALLAGAAWWFFAGRNADQSAEYRTAPVERGEIRTAISATGTLSATATIQIGTQVSGTLQDVDVDYNDKVHKDQVLARIDPSTFQAKLEQASAALASSRAGQTEAQAVARNAEVDYTRKADLVSRQLIARTDADLALAARDQARARIVSAAAQSRQQQAAVDSARLDLEKTVIRSPVEGVVLLRAVEPGQTVAASLQTPVLFQIAGDLRKMEIVLAIDEADIGQVREGQNASFTVDAFPDRNFHGRVKQVRLAATNTANVITYPVVVEVDNPDQSLLPGMTANAEIEISRRPDVLSIPNAALRFRPADASASAQGGARGGGFGAIAPANRPPSDNAQGASGNRGGGAAAMADALPKIADKLQLDASQRAAFDQALQAMRDRAARMGGAGNAAAGGDRSGGDNAGRGGNGAGGGDNAARSGNGSGGGDNAARGGNGTGGRNGSGAAGGDRSRRMAERMKQNFAAFRETLNPTQQATWDAEIAALSSGKRVPVYRLVKGKPEQIMIRIGASDGTRTEILGGELKEGDLVIVGGARPTP